MDLGKRLKETRIQSGLKQEELAHHLGVSRQTISNWENGRSLPDVGSAVKLSNVYGISLDELLKDKTNVLKTFEDLVARRRKFWQMMLEIGIILDLTAMLLAGQNLIGAAAIFLTTGILLEYLSVFMHLRVFDHDWGEILRGSLGLILHISCNTLLRAFASVLGISLLRLLAIGLIWSAGVFTIDFKSTRLWLMIALIIGVPLLNLTSALQSNGSLNNASPLGGDYQVAEVLYPEDMDVAEYTKISLSSYLRIEDRYGNSTNFGLLHYVEPTQGQTQKGIWQLIPEEAPTTLYKVTVEADDSILLACYEQDVLKWKWRLEDYGRNTCFVTVSTFGSTMTTIPTWYAPGRTDPEPHRNTDVVGKATLNLTVAGLPTNILTLVEEYHHADQIKITTYTLSPAKKNKPGSFSLELKTRYDGNEEWALYRIPFENGEYRFTLTFG